MFNFAVKKDFFFTTNKALDEKGFYCLEPTTCRCCIVCRISVRCWDNSVLACRPPGDPWRIGGGRNLRCITPCLSITLVSYCIDMLQCITHQDSIAFRLQWILLCIDSWKIRVYKGNWWEYWCGNYTGQGLPKLIASSTIIQDQAQTGPLWRVGQLYTWRMGRWTIIQYQDCRHVLAIRVIKCVKMIPVRNILRNPLNLERWQRQQRWQRERSTEHTWNCDWQATIGSWILCQDGVSPHFTTPTWWRTFPGDDIHLMITIIRDAFKNYLADVFRQGKGG